MTRTGIPLQIASSRRVREVDALRGIGALLVLLFHYTSRYGEMFPQMPGPAIGVNAGYDGVVIFFALSGFSIHFSLRRLTHVGDFAFARFARLFPAYWAALAVTVAVQLVADIAQFRLAPLEILVNLTMLQGFAHVAPVDGAYWTLAVELCFYGCMAMLWRLGLLARLEWVVAVWLALGLVMHRWSGFPEPVAQFLVLRQVHFFAIGLICSRVHAGYRSWFQQLPILAALILYIWVVEGTSVLAVVGATIAFFIAMSAGCMSWICVRPLLWVGAISYPLYLVHQHVGMTIMVKAHEAGLDYWSGFAMATVAALILGMAIHRVIERPAGDWLLAKWKLTAPVKRDNIVGGRLVQLDVLRGIGVFLALIMFQAACIADYMGRSWTFAGDGYASLLFFAIAGFGIFFAFRRAQSVSDFVVGRVARLLPVLIVAELLTLALFYADPMSVGDLSLGELGLVLCFYTCMLAFWRFGRGNRLEWVLSLWLIGPWALYYWHGMPPLLADALVLGWIGFFGMGMLSYRVWAGERRWRDQLPYIFILLLTAAGTAKPDLLLVLVVIALVFAVMVEGWLDRMCVRPILWLGAISYPLYLIYRPVDAMVVRNSGLPILIGHMAGCILAILLAILLHRFVERPGVEVIRRWRKGRHAMATPSETGLDMA